MIRQRRWAPFALLAALAAALPGCTVLKAYERTELMTRVMRDPSDPMRARFDTHVHRTREHIVGAAAGGGPSCGCN